MIQIQLQPEVEAQLTAEARARGLELERYVEKIVTARPHEQIGMESPAEAVAAIRVGRKGNRLDGLKISDLIREGRRY